jgi:uncharacterized membrane protein YjfL (UPF0719 family)
MTEVLDVLKQIWDTVSNNAIYDKFIALSPFLGIALLTLGVFRLISDKLTPYKDNKEIQADNLAAGFSRAGEFLGLMVPISASVLFGRDELTLFALDCATALVIFTIAYWALNRVILREKKEATPASGGTSPSLPDGMLADMPPPGGHGVPESFGPSVAPPSPQNPTATGAGHSFMMDPTGKPGGMHSAQGDASDGPDDFSSAWPTPGNPTSEPHFGPTATATEVMSAPAAIGAGVTSVGVLRGMAYLAVGILMFGAFQGTGENIGVEQALSLLFSLLGLGTTMGGYWLYSLIRQVNRRVANGNIPAAINAGSFLVALSLMVGLGMRGHGSQLDMATWVSDLTNYGVTTVASVLALIMVRWIALVITAHGIRTDNIAKAIILNSVILGSALMIGLWVASTSA